MSTPDPSAEPVAPISDEDLAELRLYLRSVEDDGYDEVEIRGLLARLDWMQDNLDASVKEALMWRTAKDRLAALLNAAEAERDAALTALNETRTRAVPDGHTRIDGTLYEVEHEERAWMGAETHYTLRPVPADTELGEPT